MKELKEINKNIGKRIRFCRLNNGITLSKLAKALNISTQQIQKYETGINRISAASLSVIAKTLNTNILYFYMDSYRGEDTPRNQRERLCLQVAQNFAKIENEEYQVAINKIIKTLAK